MKSRCKAQSAVEYLLLLAIVGVVVIAGFQAFLPKTQKTTEGYFNTVSRAIVGGSGTNEDGTSFNNDPKPIDGGWCGLDGQPLTNRTEKCESQLPCGVQVRYRECACPRPAFGGKHCMDDPNKRADAVVTCDSVTECPKCDPASDPCILLNPQATGCEQAQGITQCSKKACTIYAPCGNCTGEKPANTETCMGSSSETAQAWTIVTLQTCLSSRPACSVYCQPGKTVNSGGTACQ